MRRSTVASALAVGLTLSLLTHAPASAQEPPGNKAAATKAATRAEHALDTARRVLTGDPTRPGRTGRPEATLALRDLFRALPRLGTADRRDAQRILARPTDGASDPQGDGYRVPARRTCDGSFCIHWVPRTADAPPSRAWVDRTLGVMNRVWRGEVGRLRYRKPIPDGRRGGNARFDVYLKELGSRGVYGYCAPERRAPGEKWLASGYCVLDNDFARVQYGAPPRNSLRVTAAHEFFHAIQFAYDYAEDPWLMEGTATWMEERIADRIDDNRQYLRFGQLGRPGQPLDKFAPQGFNQYGNWTFFEYLSQRFGNRAVRAVWSHAGEFARGGHQYSTSALRSVLEGHGGFVGVYRAYAAGNTVPARTYSEGSAYPAAPAARTWTLSSGRPTRAGGLAVDHMAARSVLVRPGDGVRRSATWRLRVAVDGPGARTGPAAYVVVRRKDGIVSRPIALDRAGRGSIRLPFGSREVRSATVTLVNASTRFSCWHQTSWSCQGRARDDNQPFSVRATVVRRR
jgi:hypothetical protein